MKIKKNLHQSSFILINFHEISLFKKRKKNLDLFQEFHKGFATKNNDDLFHKGFATRDNDDSFHEGFATRNNHNSLHEGFANEHQLQKTINRGAQWSSTFELPSKYHKRAIFDDCNDLQQRVALLFTYARNFNFLEASCMLSVLLQWARTMRSKLRKRKSIGSLSKSFEEVPKILIVLLPSILTSSVGLHRLNLGKGHGKILLS
ncbi:hypothetical protein M9H77_18129 [Catharanthus roseus]|uniref:Uncharacterized protein n=1 Tax=Catharanthus roseus TaxID=4058 RepID=A0ACC0B6K9_CATRO|nr:hypothetical protein M9H77_18129 [Catharanthus roseus]